MSGVIDEHGQWEHCNSCGEFVLIQDLAYEQPSKQYEYGRDLCKKCVKKTERTHTWIIKDTQGKSYNVVIA